MLAHILSSFAKFEREHHMSANVLDINHTHYQSILEDYPQLFGPDAKIPLGFHICLHSDREQPHPRVRRMGACVKPEPLVRVGLG